MNLISEIMHVCKKKKRKAISLPNYVKLMTFYFLLAFSLFSGLVFFIGYKSHNVYLSSNNKNSQLVT